jgi:nitrite reductase (NADH) large subunit
VRLTPLLAGEVQFGEIVVPEMHALSAPNGALSLHTGQRVTRIRPEDKFVQTADGQHWPYDKLIIATGSRAFIPGIPGRELPGVFTFRSAEDAAALLARSISARHVVIIGGGLLGLEAARGMQRHKAQVTVVEHEGRVMPRQLDDAAGALLGEKIRELGVSLRTGVAVKEIAGTDRVEAIHLATGEILPCDTVIVCTGVRANVDLAQEAQLAFNRAIRVDDTLRTTDPDIYAVGECAEHNEVVHGLVGPGFEQAEVAVKHILGEKAAYEGSRPATKLKVIGAEVFSVGPVEQYEVSVDIDSHVWQAEGQYRRIFLRRGRLVGAIAVGGWPEASKVQSEIQREALILPWHLLRFRRTGMLWPEADEDVSAMADAATVCNCTGVTCGRLRDVVREGATTASALSNATGAGKVCGSCLPLLDEMVNAGGPPKPVTLYKALLAVSGMAALAALIVAFVPRIPYPESFTAESLTVWLWQDNIVRQWTGFILLGITLAAMIIGLRKRLRITDKLGSYDVWRLVHLGIGVLAALGLIVHTGLRPGANLNFVLFLSFTLTLAFGAAAGLATGGDHELRARRIGTARKPARRWPTWLHIIAIWPLPALLIAHVLTAYAF